MAHEINNKLAVTVGYASLLSENATTAEVARQATRVLPGVLEAAEIVHQLQQLIRFEEVSDTPGFAMLDIDALTRPDDKP